MYRRATYKAQHKQYIHMHVFISPLALFPFSPFLLRIDQRVGPGKLPGLCISK